MTIPFLSINGDRSSYEDILIHGHITFTQFLVCSSKIWIKIILDCKWLFYAFSSRNISSKYTSNV